MLLQAWTGGFVYLLWWCLSDSSAFWVNFTPGSMEGTSPGALNKNAGILQPPSEN